MKLLDIIGQVLFILLLTVLTQVGGLIWILTLFINYKTKKRKRLMFPLLYLVTNLFIVPPLAKNFGREQLPILSKELKPKNWIYPLLFRNYVTSNLKIELKDAARALFSRKRISITYLDANFPFINGFPLLPHLSHNDGKKIDISFMYLSEKGNPTNKKPSVSGYGVYVNPESNITSKDCIKKGYWQYNFSKYLTFGEIHNFSLDKSKTSLLILQLLQSKQTEKIFIEPYLKQSLGFSNENRIRFQGCQAVRHDDHIHLQAK